jgi:hypothetical protein
MKLIAITLILLLLGIEVASTQRLTYVKKEVRVIQVLKEILRQTNHSCIWDERKFNVDHKINANFKNAPLDTVLKLCFSQPKDSWIMNNKTIVLFKNDESLTIKK